MALTPHPDTSAHAAGVRKGESRAEPVAQRPTRKAKDASGINAGQRGPIDPKMPHLPPA
ncbi:MAG: hypothetical protein NVS9B15_26240 [Acidobacteriaceae bacterium]